DRLGAPRRYLPHPGERTAAPDSSRDHAPADARAAAAIVRSTSPRLGSGHWVNGLAVVDNVEHAGPGDALGHRSGGGSAPSSGPCVSVRRPQAVPGASCAGQTFMTVFRSHHATDGGCTLLTGTITSA